MIYNLVFYSVALDYLLPKDSIFHVKMWLFAISDKELRSICVRTIVCHGNNSTDTVLKMNQEIRTHVLW